MTPPGVQWPSTMDGGGVAHDRDQIAKSTRLDPENAEAAFGIVERNALDKPGQHFLGRGFLLGLHRRCFTGTNSKAFECAGPDAALLALARRKRNFRDKTSLRLRKVGVKGWPVRLRGVKK